MAFSLFSKDLGVDLGTANTLVFCKGKGIVINEPSVVAVRNGERQEVLAVGEGARAMIGRTPGNVFAVHPLKDGVIANFDLTQVMLRHFIKKAINKTGRLGLGPRVVICVPCGITEVERRAVEEAAKSAGAREAYLLEEAMAAAIGAGLPVQEPMGSMVVDVGGGTSEVAVISLGGVVVSQSLRVGGHHMDEAIVQYVRREYNMIIGERTAEQIKVNIGCAIYEGEEKEMMIRGRDLITGLPGSIVVNSSEICEALRESINAIVDGVCKTLEHTPPELAADIIQNGITLSGGSAYLAALDKSIVQATGMEVHIAENPMQCVALGAGRALEAVEPRGRTWHVIAHSTKS
ncbi:MAG: rod shape-determining protein [Bacillota bacterium]